jgi:hypothetical protein
MHSTGYDELFFISCFIEGLKWDIKAAVQVQVPDSMARAIMLAKVQQQILDNSKQKYVKSGKAPVALAKVGVDPKPSQLGQTLWKARQLRDYSRANNLCVYCGEKFDANHIEHCTKDRRLQAASSVTLHLPRCVPYQSFMCPCITLINLRANLFYAIETYTCVLCAIEKYDFPSMPLTLIFLSLAAVAVKSRPKSP